MPVERWPFPPDERLPPELLRLLLPPPDARPPLLATLCFVDLEADANPRLAVPLEPPEEDLLLVALLPLDAELPDELLDLLAELLVAVLLELPPRAAPPRLAADLLLDALADFEEPPRLAVALLEALAAFLAGALRLTAAFLLLPLEEELLETPPLAAAFLAGAERLVAALLRPAVAVRLLLLAAFDLEDLLAEAALRPELFDALLADAPFEDFEERAGDALLLRELAAFEPPLAPAVLRAEDPPLAAPLEGFEDFEDLLRLAADFEEELFDEDLPPEDLLADFLVAFAMLMGFVRKYSFSFEITTI